MFIRDPSLSTMFFIVFGISLAFNTTTILVVLQRRRLHNGHYSLMAALASVDIVFGGLWACLSGTATRTGWDMPSDVCRLQSYALTLAQMLSAFLLAATALERVVFMLKPSWHTVMFATKPVTFLVLGLTGFCGVVASIHLYGSVRIIWQYDARFCGALFSESLTLLHFTFCMDHAIPYWVLALPAIFVSFLKFTLSRRKLTSRGEIVLQRNLNAVSGSYSSALAKTQAKFSSSLASNKKKPSLGKREYTKWGYTEPEQWDSDIEDGGDTNVNINKKAPQRVYILSKQEFVLLVTSSVTIVVTSLFWLPWIVERFQWSYKPVDNSISDDFSKFAVTCMNLAATVKLLVHTTTNGYFRSALLKTLSCGRNVITQ